MKIQEAAANPGLFLMYDSCCEELENAFENGYLEYNKEENRFGAGLFEYFFNYCPFCGKKIQIEENE